jgi:hypothetical protein
MNAYMPLNNYPCCEYLSNNVLFWSFLISSGLSLTEQHMLHVMMLYCFGAELSCLRLEQVPLVQMHVFSPLDLFIECTHMVCHNKD